MSEVTKADLMFFQNELLGDIKKLELKIFNKIDSSNDDLKEKVLNSEKNIKELSDKYAQLLLLINTNKDKNEEIEKLIQFKSKVNDITSRNSSKIEQLEKDLRNTNYKFDKILDINLTLPGIIGTEKCKYKNLRDFLEYVYKSINILSTNKDKNIIDFKGYKDKLETTIKNFNLQIDNVISKYKEFCSKSIKHCESQFEKRINETEEKVQDLRIENNKYSNELINECDKFRLNYKNLEEYKNSLEVQYKENLKKQEELYHGFEKKFHNNEKDYKLIKQKFTELSDFIKSVRFRKNLGEVVKIQDFRDMSHKIDFTKKQKLEEEGVYDYYNIEDIKIPEFLNTFDDEQLLKKLEEARRHKNGVYDKRIYSGKSYKSISNHPIIINNSKSQIKNYIEQKSNHKKNISENLPNVNINSDLSRNNKNEPFILFNSSHREIVSFPENSYNQSKFTNNNTVDNNKEFVQSRNKLFIPKNNSASNIMNMNILDKNHFNNTFNSNSNQNLLKNTLIENKKNNGIQSNENNIKKNDIPIRKTISKNTQQNSEMKKLLTTTNISSNISNKTDSEVQNNNINKNKVGSPERIRTMKMKNNSMDMNIESNGNKTSRELNEGINNLSSKFKFKKKNNTPTNSSQENYLYSPRNNIHVKNINEINEFKQNINNNKDSGDENSNKNLNEYYEHLKVVSSREENKNIIKTNNNNSLINGQNNLNEIKEEENSKNLNNQKLENKKDKRRKKKNIDKKEFDNFSNSKIRLLLQNELIDKKYNSTQINHFTPLNKILENKPSNIPNEDNNILLKNLEPFIDRNFSK